MNRERREEIRARAEKATPGPWVTGIGKRADDYGDEYVYVADTSPGLDGLFAEFADDTGTERADADFIAHSRTDLPDLLDALEEQERECERLREIVRDARFWWNCGGLSSVSYEEWCVASERLHEAFDEQG